MTIDNPTVIPVTFDMPGDRQYSMIRGIPCYQDRNHYNEIMEFYASAAEARDEAFSGHLVRQAEEAGAKRLNAGQDAQVVADSAPQDRGQPAAAQSRSGQGEGQRKSRADKYPPLPNWTCNKCNGPCGRKVKTGNMSSDSVVCLGKCMEGRYVYTVGWLDNEDGGGYDGRASGSESDDLPF